MIGQTIAHYKITAKLGEGGMGEVYLAMDVTFDRPVAIKFLSAEQNADATARQRFLHEAKAQAMLNHPNVTTFLDSGEHEGRAFIVMEYVDGMSLDACVSSMKLTTAEVLDLVRQIAEGLEAAHERGVIHRDIKPQNILVTSKRRVKITDFGLARWQGASTLTRTGTQMGTVHYMSPEQTEGKRVDHRADIFSLGVILYELICARKPFDGDNPTAISYAIVSSHPQPIARYSTGVPEELQQVVDKCLAKSPDERYQSVTEMLADLRRVQRQLGWRTSGAGESAAPRIHLRVAWVTSAICFIAASTFAALYFCSDQPMAPTVHATIDAPKGTVPVTGWSTLPISPDGSSIVFQAHDTTTNELGLWVRPLRSPIALLLQATERAFLPFWSPDGRYIAFFADEKLKKIPASGGPVLTICDAPQGRGGSWGPGNVIIFAPGTEGVLHSVSATGGESTPLTVPDTIISGFTQRWPHFLPDGRHFLYLESSPPHSDKEAAIWVGSLDREPASRLIGATSNPVYAAGHLLYMTENTLIAHPFDVGAIKLTDNAFPLVENVSYNSSSLLGMFSADMSGTLAYFGGAQQDMLRVTVLDRDGHVVDSIGSREVYSGVRLSPGEDRLAVVISDESSDNSDIWIYDLDRRIRQRFTSDSSIETSPVWSPDGDRIAYRWQDAGKWEVRVKDASGIGSAKTLFESEFRCIPHDWSPDGQYLAIHFGDSARNMDIGFLPLDGTGVPLRFMPTSFTEADPKYSPDGRWIAYMTTESGRSQVCVAGSRGTTRKWQISTEDGWLPRWRRDGREIFYLSSFPVQIMVAEVDGTGEVFKVGAVRSLFPAQLRLRGSSYDVSRNGERIYLASTSSETETPSFTLVLNWPAELAKK